MMRKLMAAIAGLSLAALGLAAARADGTVTAFVGATVIDGTGAPPIADGVVVVGDDGRIAAVGPRRIVRIPDGARVFDGGGKWIIPGLIDAHIHFFQSGGLYTRPDVIDLRAVRPYEEELARVKAGLKATFARYLASGVTSVVDVGGPMWNFEVRELAEKTLLAPRVAVAGPLLATYVPAALATGDPAIIKITSPAEARAEVRRQLAHEPDLVKIWFVSPGLSIAREMEWVKAAVAESHAAGVRVVIHATRLRLARAVVEAGADILAHSIDDRPVDDDLIELMKARGVVYTTTMVVKEGYREVFGQHVALTGIERRLGDRQAIASFDDLDTLPRYLLPSWVRRRPPQPIDPVISRNLARVHAGGVIVAAGSDAGNIGTLHGPALHRELELMAREAGLAPMDVLVAATRGGARVMGMSADLGTLEPGKLADMVILNADPLADIRNTRGIHRVVKGGIVLDPEDIIRSMASEPVGP
ncbi:MAG: amidohydrolase family protein [Alphaproteobacteria bacterium]